ncbi:SET domain-containing protein SmydA-8-like isoform X1 [Harmonia axyridis]|uniref:SET domain-containing protein SmydA-8-like isoform X1 n=2 Tax=Harmonia axyridis TaxID=115357 RepID=UPI001E2755D3|nr:SET domain-containing protein SmydA-8-like isoform X1 [Harmonia axyridis]
MNQIGSCDLCEKPATQRCGGCYKIFYCCKEHQKAGWKEHKQCCRPCEVAEDDRLGRHLVSTKLIKNGEIIFRERAMIQGPAQITIPVCLGCGKAINESNSHPCTECGWPMCSEICQKNPNHIPECRYTVQRGDKVSIKNFGMIHPIYQCVTVLRCLYQKQFLPEVWAKLEKLQSHSEERKNTPKYKNERVQVAEFIRRFFKLDQIFTEEDIMEICGIVMVNCHEVPLGDPPYIGIYDTCSMLEHSCRPNCSKSFANDGSIVLVASEDIERGDHLSICYTDPLWGTPNRRHHLYESKFFWCSCPRCSDTTEFGTHFSAMKCRKKNCGGYLLPKTFLEKTDNTKNSDWHCEKCEETASCFSVQDILERIGTDMIELPKGDPEALKKFIDLNSLYLHPNHYFLTESRLALIQNIGQSEDGLVNVSDENLDIKAKTAAQLLSLFSVLTPAERRLRGMVFFELHAAVSEMGRRSFEPNIMHSRLEEAKKYLNECIDQLKNEPSCLPEGQILNQAKQNLKDIDVILQKIQNNGSDSVPVIL